MPATTSADEFERIRRGLLRTARDSILDQVPFPGENELARRMECGRGQIRRVLGSLEQEGIVIRRQGLPTVLDPVAVRRTVRLEEQVELPEMLERLGYVSGVEVIEEGQVEAAPPPARLLDGRAGQDVWRRLEVVYADSRPFALVESHILVPAGTDQATLMNEGEDLSSVSPSELAGRAWGEQTVGELATMSARALTPAEADLLRCEPNMPVLELDIIGVSRTGRRLVRTVEVHLPGLFNYSTYRSPVPF